jgi:hypothetical protein
LDPDPKPGVTDPDPAKSFGSLPVRIWINNTVSRLRNSGKIIKNSYVQHILLTIKCLLIVPNPESALNEEAGKLLLGKEVFIKSAGTRVKYVKVL